MKESIPKSFKRLRYGLAFLSVVAMGIYHTSNQIKQSRQDLYGLSTTFELPNHPNKNSPAQREYFQSNADDISSHLKLSEVNDLPSLFCHTLSNRRGTYRKLEVLRSESRKQFYEVDNQNQLYTIAGYIDYFSKQENCNLVGQYVALDRRKDKTEIGGLVIAISGQLAFQEIPARKFSEDELFTAYLFDPTFEPDNTYMAPESSANKPRIGTWHIHLDGLDHASSSGTDIENILRQSEHQVHAVISDLQQNQFNVNLFFYFETELGAKVMDIDIGNYSYIIPSTP